MSGRAAVALLALLRAAPALALTFPGPAPCNGSLQACVAGAAPGDTVRIATNGPIDEDVTIAKSLTLTAAPGFIPTLGTGPLHRTVAVEDAGPGGGIVEIAVSSLTLSNAELRVTLDADAGHRVTVSDCNVAHGDGGNTAVGIGVAVSVPSTVVLRHNTVASPGDGIRLSTALTDGDATLTVLGNRVTTFNAVQSHDGIALGLAGAGTVTAYVYSNVIHGVSGCGCQAAAGIDVSSPASVVAAVNIINNTVDGVGGGANGIQVRKPSDLAQLTVSVFNNVVTGPSQCTIDIQTPITSHLALNNGFNDLVGTECFGGYGPGPVTLDVDPLYAGPPNYRLQPGSPLVDAGTSNPVGGLPDTDADDHLRVAGAAPDIGAYELGSVAPSTTTTTSTSTTSTTLPAAACVVAVSFTSVICRLDAAASRVEAEIPAGALVSHLDAALMRARAKTAVAEGLDARGKRRGARAALGKARMALIRFTRRLRTPQAVARVPSGLRDTLLAEADRLRADLTALRGELARRVLSRWEDDRRETLHAPSSLSC
jgi:hypothetical protein